MDMRILLTSLLLALTAATAAADPAPDVSKMTTDDCARAHKLGKTCVLTIDEDGPIEGEVPTAGEKPILGWIDATHNSLIRIRRDFIPEILRTAEDL
jgi:hypothetical protein